MRLTKNFICLGLLCTLALSAFSGCASTRSENGVIIQKQGPSLNPLDYIPYL